MPDDLRPDPDALLAAVQKSEKKEAKGRLKIFLGMCPGVGKTYAMLLAAQQRQEEGIHVLIGLVETHSRIETAAMAAGLARVPRRKIEHRGVVIEEMDLDAVLERRPELALVDELAHTNAPGSRHPKRYQDVLELLDAGIDVYTTLNVQHLESHRDSVTAITGAPVHETVPDSVLDLAEEVELIDISPDELRKRLSEGKVYLGERATAAAEHFFREGNLMALREIALRLSAERADRDVRAFMRTQSKDMSWKSRERLLVAVGTSPYSGRLVRWTRRMAATAHGTWIAVYVDTGAELDPEDKQRLEQNLTLARSLGAEVVTASGTDVAEILLRVAREHGVSQIVVGKPLTHPAWDFIRGGSLVDRLIRRSGEIDVYVVRAEKTAPPWRPDFREFSSTRRLREFALGTLVVLGVTLLGLLLRSTIGYMAVGLLYLLSVLLSSSFLSRWPILFTAALTALAWNFLFITPYLTFYIGNVHDVILFGMYFVVALVLGQLHTRLRVRERMERLREEQTTALYRFSRDLSVSRSLGEALKAAASHIDALFRAHTSIFVAHNNTLESEPRAGEAVSEREFGVAVWALHHNEAAGRQTNTLPQSDRLYLPLRTAGKVAGVMGLKAAVAPGLQERQMLETFGSQMALLIERDRLQKETEQSRLEEKSRHLQKTLLDGVSHEFKTPLAVISAALDNLQTARPEDSLLEEIRLALSRLQRVVHNLLTITRIETGTIQPRLEWCDLQEIVDMATQRAQVGSRQVRVHIATDVAVIRVDVGLLEEILANLLRNASQHSKPGAPIAILAQAIPEGLEMRIQDEGAGVSNEEIPRLFEKFQRGPEAPPGGLGMGLSIVRGFVTALGGEVSARRREDGISGLEFCLHLPVVTKTSKELERVS